MVRVHGPSRVWLATSFLFRQVMYPSHHVFLCLPGRGSRGASRRGNTSGSSSFSRRLGDEPVFFHSSGKNLLPRVQSSTPSHMRVWSTAVLGCSLTFLHCAHTKPSLSRDCEGGAIEYISGCAAFGVSGVSSFRVPVYVLVSSFEALFCFLRD